jgi:hypothetical protein
LKIFGRIYFRCHDLLEYFANLTKLPDIEELEDTARKLHNTYSTSRGMFTALSSSPPDQMDWKKIVPVVNEDVRSAESGVGYEDQILASSIAFMRDALVSREFSYAIADGDVGRAYEVLKVCHKCST